MPRSRPVPGGAAGHEPIDVGDGTSDTGQLGLLTGNTWWSRTILFIIGAGTGGALQLSGDLETGFQWLLLIFGVAGCGALALVGGQTLNRRLSNPKRPTARRLPPRARWRVVRAAALVLGLAAGAVFAATEAWSRIDRLVNGCPVPTQLRALTTVESLAATREIAAAFEQWTAEADDGCRRVDVFVYAAPETAVVTALADGWGRDALRDIGPRPDVWLPDSGLQVDAVRERAAGRDSHLGVAQPIAWSPLVVALPEPLATAAIASNASWREVVDLVASAGGVLVRSGPESSIVGAIATHAIYAQFVPEAEDPTAPAMERRRVARELELRIETAPVLGDGPGLLCRYTRVGAAPSPAAATVPPAIVTTEQALARFRSGGCSARNEAPDVDLAVVYPSQTPALIHQFVPLHWSGAQPGGPQEQAARLLGDWLVSPDGQAALATAGLSLGETSAVRPVFADFEADLTLSRQVRRPGRVVLAVDVSGSMDYPAGDGRTRFQVASTGVESSLTLMRDEDEFGLMVFPDEPQGTGTRIAVPVGPRDDRVNGQRRVEAVTAALAETAEHVGGNTPLYDAIVDGLALAADGQYESEPLRALVVLTDGVNTTGTRSAADAIAAAQSELVQDRGVRVYVIAIGEASCHGEVVAAITQDPGNGCQQVRADDVGSALRNVFAAVWGGGA